MTVNERKLANRIVKYNFTEESNNAKLFDKESTFQAYVVRRLKAVDKTHISWFKVMKANKNGVSDLILCVHGKFVAIELKHRGGKPTPLQLAFIDEVKSSGGIGEIAWLWKDVKKILLMAGFDIEAYEKAKLEAELQETV